MKQLIPFLLMVFVISGCATQSTVNPQPESFFSAEGQSLTLNETKPMIEPSTSQSSAESDLTQPSENEVVKRSHPTLSLNGSAIVYLKAGEIYQELGATAIDADGNELSVEILGTVDTAWVNIYELIYRTEDSYGLVSEVKREVHVTVPDITDFNAVRLNQTELNVGDTLSLVLIPVSDARMFDEVKVHLGGQNNDTLSLSTTNIQADQVRFDYVIPSNLPSNRYSFGTIEWRIGNITGIIYNLKLIGTANFRLNLEPTPPAPVVVAPEPTPVSLEPSYQALHFDQQSYRPGETIVARLAYQGDPSGYRYRLNMGIQNTLIQFEQSEITETEIVFHYTVPLDIAKGNLSGAALIWETDETNGILVNVSWSYHVSIVE